MSRLAARPLDESPGGDVENLSVQKGERACGLISTPGSESPGSREVLLKLLDMAVVELSGMRVLMKVEEAAYPFRIGGDGPRLVTAGGERSLECGDESFGLRGARHGTKTAGTCGAKGLAREPAAERPG